MKNLIVFICLLAIVLVSVLSLIPVVIYENDIIMGAKQDIDFVSNQYNEQEISQMQSLNEIRIL
jgi:hypothetical protein